MPQSFAKQTQDTTSTARVSWKEFFADNTLNGLIDEALKNNLDVLATLQNIEKANADVRLRKGQLLPTLSGAGTAAIRKYGLYTMDGAGNATTDITAGRRVPKHLPDYFLGFQSNWEADIWGKLRNKKRAAVSRYLASVEGRNLVVTQLVAEIARNYYGLLALDNELDIIRESIKIQEDALSVVRSQKEAGQSNALAVQQFEAQVLNAKALEMEILQRVVETESAINLLLGRFPQPISRDKTLFLSRLPTHVRTGVPAELLKNRPDIRQAELNLLANKADLQAARKAFYPSFNITGLFGYQAFSGKFLFSTPESIAYGLVGNLTAPLINRAAIRAEFNTAQASQLESFYTYQKSILTGYVEVYNELARVRNLEQLYQFKNNEVQILTQSIGTASELFRTGRANYLEVLLTQQNALQAKIALIINKQQQFETSVNLYKALGGGWR
jgi:NodT family efflux transporter outer membrane factor (OMF) lipoprotein